MKFPIRMELEDPFENLEIPVLQNFVTNGWNDWVIEHYNPNQLELFDKDDVSQLNLFND